MKCFNILLIMTLFSTVTVNAEKSMKDELRAVVEEIKTLKTFHITEVSRLKEEIEELKNKTDARYTSTEARNEQSTLSWAQSSIRELRGELHELSRVVNSSGLLRQLHGVRNGMYQALAQTSDLSQLARKQEARVDKMDGEVERLKYDMHQIRTMIAELRAHVGRLSKEVKTKQMNELNQDLFNEVDVDGGEEMRPAHAHRLRHNKMMHTQISRLARSQNQLDEYQQNLQTQVLDVQRRLDRFEEPNWNLLSTKVDILELETKIIRNDLRNTTQKLSDFDKIHASVLELREDIENIENKADKIIPEFRKEISKLDISFAQLTAQSSYLKEDQENLRQSVKAIAVSVSNTIDHAEIDRLTVRRINDSIYDLTSRSKQHFYRLNDHILKSEANSYDMNITQIVPLPELMGEVKELQPVEREYEDLVKQLPRDCSSIFGPAGSYLIRPGQEPVDTWCANGTTLLQRRFNGSVEFNRKFSEYVHGFGDVASEYWLGLESMHLLTANNCSSMRIDMTDIYGGNWYAEYEGFNVDSADTGFVLEVTGFKGNASDAFEYQNHMEFSAIDRDRDISNTHCAGNYEGGWWYSHCQHVNINGKYTLGLTWFDSSRNEWIAVATSEMRLLRRPGCP